MGERLLCKQEVIGSIPFSSTNQLTAISGQRAAGSGQQMTVGRARAVRFRKIWI